MIQGSGESQPHCAKACERISQYEMKRAAWFGFFDARSAFSRFAPFMGPALEAAQGQLSPLPPDRMEDHGKMS
jgi:hypothetical protein